MNWQVNDFIEEYIEPAGAKEKLAKSEAARQPVLIVGGIGFGKTELLKQYFINRNDYEMFSARDVRPEELQSRFFPREAGKKGTRQTQESRILIIDDLYGIFGSDSRRQWKSFFERCREDKGLWLIVSSRSSKIPYFQKVYGTTGLTVISEPDLILSYAQVEALLRKHGVVLSPEEMARVYERSGGNPLWTSNQLRCLKELEDVEKALRKSRKDAWKLAYENFCKTWPQEILELVVSLSILSSFDLAVAEEITGISGIKRVLDKAEELGDFIIKDGSTYRVREALRLAVVAQQYRKRKRVGQKWREEAGQPSGKDLRRESAMKEAEINYKELEIIKLMALGMTNEEIGNGLGVREVTIKYHNMKIFRKLGVKSRVQVVREAQRRGLI